ncbi:UNVERIFIED_CONTAM: putative galactinol--sucrose galactosyltransferase 2 [Sesamum calycinum]|uniref:Galactinol--sucrose galactosyltransferase 2 n=1 Tax=Sesamum calycinum TaxID=2727403 RepID=A0AAW2IUE0_9LAMI
MTITAVPVIKNGCLMVRGKVVLTGVPDNVVVSPTSAGSAFIGANSTTLSSRHVFNLGVLEDCKFMCLFLAKIWWMIPRVGKSASEIPMETQMLLLEAGEESVVGVVDDDSPTELANDNKFYVLVLPVLDGAFRTTLQGTPSNELQFCYESGDSEVQTSQALEGVFVNSGDNPFELIKIQLTKHKGTFSHLETKKAPAHLDWFGWCTWDAFYTEVSPNGIKEGLQSSKKSATARASEDFMPNEPTFQTLHIASVSFNSLLLGEIVVPDWDMFHSNHNTAEFHAAARALGGCPVYVSDKPGKHDFKILQKLVLPDGSVLRARYAGRPTRDCLFVDPVMDGKSLLKIWNLNKLTGVVGVFNCQGAGSWPMKQAAEFTKNSSAAATSCSGRVSPLDVEFLDEIAEENWTGDCAVYAFNSGSVSRVPKSKTLEVTLGVLQCEIFTVSPVKVLNDNIQFAPIGLIHMYNSGGAVEECSFKDGVVRMKARGWGLFGAYSSVKPISCKVDSKDEDFSYRSEDGLVTVNLQSESSFKD